VLKLYLCQKAWDLIDINPYGMKTALFMQRHAIPHAVIYEPSNNSSPSGQLPYLVDGDHTVTDSNSIIDYLIKKYSLKGDEHVLPQNQSVALLIQRVLEEHLYPVMLYSRIVDPSGLAVFKRELFTDNNGIHENKVNLIRSSILDYIHGRGFKGLQAEMIYQRGVDDLKAINQLMPNSGYFFGEKLVAFDIILFSFLANIHQVPLTNSLNDYVANSTKMVAYLNYCEQHLQNIHYN